MGNRIIKYLRYLLDCLLEIVYPKDEKCVICGELIDEDDIICTKCISTIKFYKGNFMIKNDGYTFLGYSVAYYCDIISELVLKLKYKSNFRCGELLGRFMIDKIKKENIKSDIITYVPSTKKSLKKRGYNQSEYLANIVGESINKPVVKCLCKSKETKDQIGLGNKQRWKNVKDSFKILDNKKIYKKNILLIDDVITTGATVFFCCNELIKNGAKKVIVLTVAKSRL